ncbi:MAG: response regulator transcription factor [Oscillospiraceae bacterium]|nr:response regulator transcription factor [Oscillospiraceae bacterium]
MLMILVIEDDKMINGLLCKVLTDAGHPAESAFDGATGLEMALNNDYEMILLDLMLPGKKGEDVLQRIRQSRSTPAIVLSAKSEVYDRIELLKMGADDYICKPFDIDEVILRIEAVLRRSATQSGRSLDFKKMSLDREAKCVYIEGRDLGCTAMEYAIMELMLSNPNKVFSKRNLFESITGEEYLSEDNTMNVHISNLRKKIAKVTEEPYIDTVYGMGYRLSKNL